VHAENSVAVNSTAASFSITIKLSFSCFAG
jgi:hypothetical protein